MGKRQALWAGRMSCSVLNGFGVSMTGSLGVRNARLAQIVPVFRPMSPSTRHHEPLFHLYRLNRCNTTAFRPWIRAVNLGEEPRTTRPSVEFSGQRNWPCLLGATTENDRFFGIHRVRHRLAAPPGAVTLGLNCRRDRSRERHLTPVRGRWAAKHTRSIHRRSATSLSRFAVAQIEFADGLTR